MLDNNLLNLRYFLIRFLSGFGASIFRPLLKVAKVLIPKSIPTELSVLGKIWAQVSTTKLKKYLVGANGRSPLQSLIIVTDDGVASNSHRRYNFQPSNFG